jgi:DNA-binding NarL/FixJ family response regulator
MEPPNSPFSTLHSQLTRVAVVDDHKMVVESLSKLINDSGIAQVTDVYYNLKSCRLGLAERLPDLLLLDIGLPDGDGVDFCAEIAKAYPALKIIMLTSYKEFSIAKRALHNGALGYILKNAESEEMIAGIETVNRGELFLCEEIDVLLKDKKDEAVVWLSPREKEILQYIAEGYTTNEVADRIFRDAETVKTYRRNLLVKLNAKNVAVLIKKAYEQKLLSF